MRKPSFTQQFRGQLPQVVLTGFILSVAGLLLAMYAAAAVDWWSQPFMGFLPLRNMEISNSESLVGAEWPALDAELKPGDRLVSIDQVPLDTLPASERIERFNEVVSEHEAGQSIPTVFLRENASGDEPPRNAICRSVPGEPDQCNYLMLITTKTMPTGDMISYFGVGWGIAVLLWIIAVAIFFRRPANSVVHMIAWLIAALAVYLAGSFDAVSTHQLVPAYLLAGHLLGGMLMMFALEFPHRLEWVQKTPGMRFAPLAVAGVLGAIAAIFYYSADPNLYNIAFIMPNAVVVLGGIILGVTMFVLRERSSSPIARNQRTIVVMGLVPWLLFLLGGTIQLFMDEPWVNLTVFNQVLPLLLPLSLIYASSQLRLVDTDRVITQSIMYGMLAMLVVAYWLIVTGIAQIFEQLTNNTVLNTPVFIAVSIFLIALFFEPLRVFMQRQIDNFYFKARHNYQKYLQDFAREVTDAASLKNVISLVQSYLGEAINPDHVILFVRNNVTQDFRPEPDPAKGYPLTDITFTAESGLLRYLREQENILHLKQGEALPMEVISDGKRLGVLDSRVLVGLKSQNNLIGFLAIGPRQGGGLYVHEDLRFIVSLSDQIGLAVERARVIDDLEHRVRVQDVLSQVSRALNFAIDFDTLLELVYAQTIRVIDAPNFYIALRNPNTDELTYVFYNEGDERVMHMEGHRWRMGRDLISEIARTQQTIRTDDFVRESLLRDPRAQLDNSSLKAWMGVPLLADTGGGVLGVMVASTTEPGKVFTDEQQDLFWDIANLAASALDKLQLFEKTQQRARQLSAINEISSQLAAELGDVDRLLRLITENAVQILGAEAGSLLLVEEESGDLGFHVVVGGSGQELIGTRIPAGVGLAGATVQRAAPIIVNDPSRDSRWYGDVRATGEEAPAPSPAPSSDGFQSNAILSVPLLVQGRVIGVLQTINKRDGGIFIQEDADLLVTFAGQAAIAIENARLFDMTDQQLGLRVQELDTMQRIDQELNRTLNLTNVVDITMDWALRKSGAMAGAMFIMDRTADELRLVAAYGYPPDSLLGKPSEEDRTYPTDRGIVGRVIRSGQPALVTDVNIDPDYDETLPGCVAQLTVPLFSANRVIGVMILESDRENELDLLDLDFVARLAEHASPAIANSQLFQELQNANQDKSRFVSLVAHELKNPMTSAKGYTDLMLKGVVGPVNEQQASFLTTVLSNVNRMETLVSDLNDLTKQETGNMKLEIFPLDFRNVVVETLRGLQRQIEEKDQTLNLEVPEALPLIMGDQNRLIQVLVNFVSNAYKYSPSGGTITIHAEAARNLWDPQGASHVVHCYVKDTGIGMSEDDLAKLFKPYFRSENPKTREQPGTGLGLTITKGLIEQHGGRVWVESELEVGTTFHFTIPLAPEQTQIKV